MTEKQGIENAVRELGLQNSEVCIHASMRSFGAGALCGPSELAEAFLDNRCTILVPTFSYRYSVAPEDKNLPRQNGGDDFSGLQDRIEDGEGIFHTESKEISAQDMGAFAKFVLSRPLSRRGNHPLNSFTALGDNAKRLIAGQTPRNVYAPLAQLCADNGYVLLMGVSLNSATILHYAEQVAGRTLLVRWAKNSDGKVMPVSVGSCSRGFHRLYEHLKPYEKRIAVGSSNWSCYRAAEIVEVCAQQIRKDPGITHCDDVRCDRCNDIVKGGPILDPFFWEN